MSCRCNICGCLRDLEFGYGLWLRRSRYFQWLKPEVGCIFGSGLCVFASVVCSVVAIVAMASGTVSGLSLVDCCARVMVAAAVLLGECNSCGGILAWPRI